ncbi:MAG: trypsin-like peptidase domain-containing protein [Verrucomicrobiota bacterium]
MTAASSPPRPARTRARSIFQGGAFSLRIAPASPGSAWHITVAQAGDAAGPASIASNYLPPPLVAASSNTAGASAPATNAAPTLPQAPNPSTYVAPPPSMPSMMTIASSTGGAPGAGNLTDAQAHAVVVIKGDRGEGTGFLVTTPDGPAVVTNQHVLSANPNVKIFTTSGAQVQTIGLKGAADRDLAMIAIRDDHYTYLTLATDIAGSVQVGDEVVTPGNSEGGEVLLDTRGTVLGIGPQRIEISNPVFHGNSGGPIFHLKSGKVIAVVTEAVKVRASDDVDRASAANKDSAITGTVRYFGLRPTTCRRGSATTGTGFSMKPPSSSISTTSAAASIPSSTARSTSASTWPPATSLARPMRSTSSRTPKSRPCATTSASRSPTPTPRRSSTPAARS